MSAQIVFYSIRPILPFTNTDVSRYILMPHISIFAKCNMDRREYYFSSSKNISAFPVILCMSIWHGYVQV
jgi:hypothetical protein